MASTTAWEKRLNVSTRAEWREWLQKNAASASYCWITVSMKPVPGKLLYLDAVEEALCAGWIDGMKQKGPDHSLLQRMSPRKQGSSWTELNKERARRLKRLGLMESAGRRALPDMGRDSFAIDPAILQKLKEDPGVYANFLGFPELYTRIRIDTIQSVKRQPELFAKRLEKFIARTRENHMYGQWHDDGRLLGTDESG